MHVHQLHCLEIRQREIKHRLLSEPFFGFPQHHLQRLSPLVLKVQENKTMRLPMSSSRENFDHRLGFLSRNVPGLLLLCNILFQWAFIYSLNSTHRDEASRSYEQEISKFCHSPTICHSHICNLPFPTGLTLSPQ